MPDNMGNQTKDPMEWEVLESEYLYKRPWLTARREHVKLPDEILFYVCRNKEKA